MNQQSHSQAYTPKKSVLPYSTIYNSQNVEATQLSIDNGWIKKQWYIYTVVCYSAIRRNTFESVLTRWMILEPIIQSEVSQKEKHKYSILRHIYETQKNDSEEFISVQFSAVPHSCLTLCVPMNRSTPGLPVHHQLPEFTQTHLHRVSDAIQTSHPLAFPSPPAPDTSQNQSLFQGVNSSQEVAKVLEFHLQHHSFPINPRADLLQNGLVGSPCSPRDSQETSPTPQFKSFNSSALSFLHSPTLTSIHDHWKNHSLDQMKLCWQSNVSAF